MCEFLVAENLSNIYPRSCLRKSCYYVFRYDGQPKFGIDLSGQGQNKLLVPAQNVQYLPQKWCTFNPNAKDLSKLGPSINFACTYADCTPLEYGSSCNGLDTNGNASYAFNMYFQVQNQKPESCAFQGLAMITTQNISQGTCNFPIGVVSSTSSLLVAPTPLVVWLLVMATPFLLR